MNKRMMEYINAVLINEGLPQRERLIKLNKIAIQQMSVLRKWKTGNCYGKIL